MKKIILILLVFAGLSSCKDFLEVAPDATIQTSELTAFKNGEDLEKAVNGIYKLLAKTYNPFMLILSNIRSDDSYSPRLDDINSVYFAQAYRGDLSIYRSNELWNYWQAAYLGIRSCNLLLANADNAEATDEEKTKAKAAAAFCRAYMYSDLVKVFGDVPLILDPISNIQQSYTYLREPAAKVYDQIYKDLDFAIDNLPPSTNPAIATVNAALFLKVRVLLYQAKETFSNDDEALTLIQRISGYKLLSSFSDLWNKPSTKNSEESIFELQFTNVIGLGSAIPRELSFPEYVIGAPLSSSNPNGLRNGLPTTKLKDAFLPADNRAAATWEFFGRSVNKPISTINLQQMKWISLGANTAPVSETANNLILMRYADLLLLKAELLNRTGDKPGAIEAVKFVRDRANLTDVIPPEISEVDLDILIENQRFIELAFEGQRFWDLVRRGRLVSVMTAFNNSTAMKAIFATYNVAPGIVDHDDIVYPIPYFVILNNPLITQNLGYN